MLFRSEARVVGVFHRDVDAVTGLPDTELDLEPGRAQPLDEADDERTGLHPRGARDRRGVGLELDEHVAQFERALSPGIEAAERFRKAFHNQMAAIREYND